MSNKNKARAVKQKASYEPVRISTKDKVEEIERVPLFYIDDDEYTIPKKFAPNVGIQYLRDLNEDGRDFAVARLMKAALGSEAFDALADCESITKEQMEKINGMIIELALGAVDEGN